MPVGSWISKASAGPRVAADARLSHSASSRGAGAKAAAFEGAAGVLGPAAFLLAAFLLAAFQWLYQPRTGSALILTSTLQPLALTFAWCSFRQSNLRLSKLWM